MVLRAEGGAVRNAKGVIYEGYGKWVDKGATAGDSNLFGVYKRCGAVWRRPPSGGCHDDERGKYETRCNLGAIKSDGEKNTGVCDIFKCLVARLMGEKIRDNGV